MAGIAQGLPGHPDLHLGDHRRAQGRDALALEPGQQHPRRRGGDRQAAPGGEADALLPAAEPLAGAHGGLLRGDPPRLQGRLRREHAQAGGQHGRGPPDDAGQRAADLREALRQGDGRAPRRASSSALVLLGPGHGQGARRLPRRQPPDPLPPQASSTPSPTRWSSPRCTTSWAAGSSTPSAAARRWRWRSPTSSSHRAHHLRGLRPLRDLARAQRQQAGAGQDRLGGHPLARRGDQDRPRARPGARRRDRGQRAQHHAGLLQQARGHRGGASPRTAGSRPATSATSTATASSSSPIARRS